ncbi:M1 family metallopeptidase [Haloechinothrix halophila]|uniref:M1 family metallopeptidase n=1 Tax=Haloechinothrix halophila TaxID=1069073 RepID=UPI00041A2193|nr:M1 family metallopeptidase [Haloechinothrix halophila]
MTVSPQRLLLCCLALTLTGCTGPARDAEEAPPTATKPTHGAAGAGDPYYPTQGNGGYDVRGYDVDISYDPHRKHLDGDTTITATATQPLTRFNLDLRGFDVKSVTVNDEQAEFARKHEHELVITPAEPIGKGDDVVTRVRYNGEPTSTDEDEFATVGWLTTSSGGSYALGEPHSASFWYPVNETPRDKATFTLSARVPKDWVAVSIGKQTSRRTKDGWTTYTWEETNPAASYVTTVAIDKFTVERSRLDDGTPVLSAYAPGQEGKRELEARAEEIVEFLSSKFGPYPQRTAGGIYMSDSISFALETQGRPTYASWADLDTVVHEYAHQWHGNSVTIESWSDLCLSECFASYSEWLWAEAKDDTDLDRFYREQVDQLSGDDSFWESKLHEMGAGNEFDGMYGKSKLAMHALRRTIGDDVFDQVLREWPQEHQHGNASWPEFEQFVSERTDVELGEFFDVWFRGDEIPSDEHLYPGTLRP